MGIAACAIPSTTGSATRPKVWRSLMMSRYAVSTRPETKMSTFSVSPIRYSARSGRSSTEAMLLLSSVGSSSWLFDYVAHPIVRCHLYERQPCVRRRQRDHRQAIGVGRGHKRLAIFVGDGQRRLRGHAVGVTDVEIDQVVDVLAQLPGFGRSLDQQRLFGHSHAVVDTLAVVSCVYDGDLQVDLGAAVVEATYKVIGNVEGIRRSDLQRRLRRSIRLPSRRRCRRPPCRE